jgi:hypothetical protein
MIAKVFEELSILLEACVEPGELIRLKLGILIQVSGFGHLEMVSAAADRMRYPDSAPFPFGRSLPWLHPVLQWERRM